MKRTFILAIAVLVVGVPVFGQNANANSRALDAAMAHFNANARAYGLTNPSDELKVRNSIADGLGQTHIRYDQYFRGVRVFEGEAIGHVDGRGRVNVTNALRGNLNVSTTPTISEATATSKALAGVNALGGTSTTARLEILPQGQRSATTRLVWHVTVDVENDAQDRGSWDYFVDAKSGNVVWSFNSLETSNATGVGRTQYLGDKAISLDLSGTTYSMRDVSRSSGNYTCDKNGKTNAPQCTVFTGTSSTFGDGVLDGTNRATSAADAHVGLQYTWDYYKNFLGRNGIDNTGKATSSRVHYGSNYNNAFWSDSCFCMTYGDGSGTAGGTSGFLPLVSIDVAGHEMSHGVTSTSANLTYSGESGGLNESNSDIFGTMVEFYAYTGTGIDTPDYLIGEIIYPSNWNTNKTWKNLASPKALRYMTKPSLDGSSPNCWSSSVGSLDVHYSSGPNNHMFYLLSNGGTSACNGNVVAGIGNANAAKIWYRALTVYMTASTNYAGARTAALNAATDLFGTGSTQYNAVAAAFSGINVN
jgi:Zn-dependent metalloprotease